MSYRSNAAQVREVLETDEDIQVEPFIKAANSIVNWLYAHCAEMASLSTDDLELIETWLAAHYYSQKDPALTQRTTGGASGSFQGQVAMYFEGTWYGQKAMELDHSGCLAKRQQELKTGQKTSASIGWAGKRTSERLDAWERE
jgi:hypothetical protein